MAAFDPDLYPELGAWATLALEDAARRGAAPSPLQQPQQLQLHRHEPSMPQQWPPPPPPLAEKKRALNNTDGSGSAAAMHAKRARSGAMPPQHF